MAQWRAWTIGLGALIVTAAGAFWWNQRPESADTRFSGAYAMDDGTPLVIVADAGSSLRYRLMNGETGVVWPAQEYRYVGGLGWREREPVANTMTFTVDAGGRPTEMKWERADRESVTLRRIDLPERIVKFRSGSLSLRGKLVSPRDNGPFPALVIVHGGERTSAVDYYAEPYFYAANGFAAFVFDKRGTGQSEGEYLQNFSVLASDVRAALGWLRDQDQIDDERINLVGFSQGGWIAPLVAKQDGHIRSIVVGFGPLVSSLEEDRWGYVHELQQRGFGADAVRAADSVNEILKDIMSREANRWDELGARLEEVRHEPWAEAVKGADSALGRMLATDDPIWKSRLIYWWNVGRHKDPPFIEWSYDPMPTVAALSIPSLWFFGADDSSMPTAWTLERIEKLQAAGKPVEAKVFAGAEHGMLRYETRDGHTRPVGYDPDYLSFHIDWLRGRNFL